MASYPGFALPSAKAQWLLPKMAESVFETPGWFGQVAYWDLLCKQINEVETYPLALYLTHVQQITSLQ